MEIKDILYNIYMLKRQNQALEIVKELHLAGAISGEDYKRTLLKLLHDAGFTNGLK